ncbi:hypothetical protein JOQ06_027617 [Pogonophryne albipinna]|uniref:Uncharacterized protein n=1 Tax=Pogonophryne albipinna TaxID=1090488 RepID=A0AAD6A4U1_9TELE|nr:hypothetical protein JOQ06_027617 [Pogonophryne albipinna]
MGWITLSKILSQILIGICLSVSLSLCVCQDADVLVEYRPLEDSDPSNMLCAGKDSSSVMEWDQCSGEKLLETQQSYEDRVGHDQRRVLQEEKRH